MGKAILHFWKKSATITLIYLIFAIVGMVGLLVPQGIWQVLLGVVMFGCPTAVMFFIGLNAGRDAYTKGRKLPTDINRHLRDAQSYRPWNGALIGLMFALPIIVLLIVAIIFKIPFIRGLIGLYFSGFSAIFAGSGLDIIFSGTPDIPATEDTPFQPAVEGVAFGYSWLFLIMIVLAVALYAFGYFIGGYRMSRQYKEIQQEIRQFGGKV